jgi:hypothetical protein
MQLLTESRAQTYAPTTLAAKAGATAFLHAADTWGSEYTEARQALSRYLSQNVPAKAQGFLSSDALNMSAFGVMFDKNPGAGFIAVPGPVADKLDARGLRGAGYFPDLNHAVGKQVMQLLRGVSRVAEKRPLLNAVPGVSSVAIEGEGADARVVLSRAVKTADGVAIVAAPSALKPTAEVTPVIVKALASIAEQTATATADAATPTARRGNRM